MISLGPSQELKANNLPLRGSRERPAGEWNTLEWICLEDTAVILLNGKLHGAMMNLRLKQPDGKEIPLTSGVIRLAAYSPAWFRNIEVREITELPRELIDQSAGTLKP